MTSATGLQPVELAPHSQRLERVFSACFEARFHTRLQGGADEPLYSPASSTAGAAVIYYREDYFASALHEVAHWCIAGEARRQQTDFGYWYSPDGRSPQQQRAFEQVEFKPQALEWFFSKACGARFRVSLDNLEGLALAQEAYDSFDFKRRVQAQAVTWQTEGLPDRALCFYRALCLEFDTRREPQALDFDLAELL